MKKIGNHIVESHKLINEVISCQEAATAKGIPLKNELKTLILQTSNGLYALHLPGDKKASFRVVKNTLKVNEAFLASKDEMKKLGLTSGTVSPVKQSVWDLHHLISQDLLELEFVSTNDGTRKGYIIFKPLILLSAKNVKIGNFSEH
jgi:prolyl-tRNA editing enzyme YbaK/EbsC (Cys-tRNA(Pro) deacylase)